MVGGVEAIVNFRGIAILRSAVDRWVRWGDAVGSSQFCPEVS
jgi:hypothetical protein